VVVLRRKAPDPTDPIAQATAAGVDEGEEGVLATVSRFLSRPGYVVRSLLRGRPDDAVQNSAQFFLDLPTGGWLNPSWSLANLFSETGDITTKEERPEFTDLVGKTGSGLGDAALDVLGGIVTDPLTFLPFAGVGKAGLAAASGSRAIAASRLTAGLKETARGSAALAAAAPEVVAGLATRFGRGLTPELLASEQAVELLGGGARGATRASRLRKVAEARTAEKVLADAFLANGEATADAARVWRQNASAKYLEAVGPQELTPEALVEARAALAKTGELSTAISQPTASGWHRAQWLEAGRVAQTETGFDAAGAFRRFGTTADGRDPLTAGLRTLEERGATVPDGALTFKIPLVPHTPVVLTRGGAFGQAARALIPGKLATDAVAAGALGPTAQRMAIDMRRLVDDRAIRAFEWAKSNLYSKVAPAGEAASLGQAAADHALRASHLGARVLANGATRIARAFEGVNPAQASVLGKAWLAAGDHFQQILAAGSDDGKLNIAERAINAAIGTMPDAARMRIEALSALPPSLARGYSTGQRELLGRLTVLAREQALRDGVEAGLTRDRVLTTLDDYTTAMGEIAEDLVKLGVWDEKIPNPFYAPFQAGKDVAGFLARKPDKKLGQAMLDVFTQRKDFRNSVEFEAHLRKVAAEAGLNAPDGLVETNLAELMARRIAAHADTVERVTLGRSLRKQFPGARWATPTERYLERQFSAVGARENTLLKILGGGKILTKLTSTKLDEGDALEAANAGHKVVAHPDGGLAIEKKWEGLNFYAKPALTLPFPSFYGRNVVSMVVSAVTDPEMGPAIGKQILSSMWDAPILRTLTGRGQRTPDTAALIARAVRDPDSLTDAQKLALQSELIGKHPASQIVRMAREGVAKRNYPDTTVFEAGGKLDELAAVSTPAELRQLERVLQGKELVSENAGLIERLSAALHRVPASPERAGHNLLGKPGATAANLRNELVRPLGAINSWIEDSARVGTFVRLVEGGMDPIRAQQRVERVFVNYDVVSPTERALRDLIPFARYAIGSVPVTLENVARRPGGFFPAATRTLVNRQEEGQFLPEHVRGKAALQVGTDREGNPIYASSLGLPFDAAADALGMVGRPFSGGIRRGLLAAGQPQLRATAEGVLGQSFYFGGDPLAYRAAPRVLPDALTTVTTLPSGKKIREIPGWVNHWLLGASPLSRFRSELDGLLDERLDPGSKAVDALTGVRLGSVDQRVQARRAIVRWLEEREASGEVGKIEAFFTRGEGDEKLDQAIKALDSLRKGDKKKKAPKPAPGVR
jgi:hypothetical protein